MPTDKNLLWHKKLQLKVRLIVFGELNLPGRHPLERCILIPAAGVKGGYNTRFFTQHHAAIVGVLTKPAIAAGRLNVISKHLFQCLHAPFLLHPSQAPFMS